MKRLVVFPFYLLVLSLVACQTSQSLQVTEAWARPGFKGDASAVYFLVRNPSHQADSLILVHTDVAERSEIHESTMGSGDTMHMEMHPSLEIPADGSIELAPGGYHVMLIGLIDDLTPGEEFTLRLTFEKAGEISVPVKVKQP